MPTLPLLLLAALSAVVVEEVGAQQPSSSSDCSEPNYRRIAIVLGVCCALLLVMLAIMTAFMKHVLDHQRKLRQMTEMMRAPAGAMDGLSENPFMMPPPSLLPSQMAHPMPSQMPPSTASARLAAAAAAAAHRPERRAKTGSSFEGSMVSESFSNVTLRSPVVSSISAAPGPAKSAWDSAVQGFDKMSLSSELGVLAPDTMPPASSSSASASKSGASAPAAAAPAAAAATVAAAPRPSIMAGFRRNITGLDNILSRMPDDDSDENRSGKSAVKAAASGSTALSSADLKHKRATTRRMPPQAKVCFFIC
jgi:hypothetical protein